LESGRAAGCVGSNSGIIYDERVNEKSGRRLDMVRHESISSVDVVVGDDVRYNLLVLFVAGHWANSFRF